MAEKLKREFIDLLERDVEFRYTVAGYLGLSEILKRLDKLEEGQNKLWEEVKSLREGQNRLWEGQNRLWEEVKSLREGQNKLWEEVKALRVEQERMRRYMVSGFSELRSALGVTYEMHAAAYIELLLDEMGYHGARVERKYILHDEKILEINIFSEKPLIVGEVKTHIGDTAEAEEEIRKLMEKAEAVKRNYGKDPELVILSVGTAPKEVVDLLKAESEKQKIKLILGREIEEQIKI